MGVKLYSVFVLVWAHLCACMPPCTPLIWSDPLAGNLSIEIRKKNRREECLWLSQRGIYNGLQAALTSPSLSFSVYLSLAHTHIHIHKHKYPTEICL